MRGGRNRLHREDGVEIAVPVEHAERVARALLDAGVQPAGLGARDTLRLEAALPLHGHELSADITTLEADLGWVIGWDKPDFSGRRALAEQRETGIGRVLCGLRSESRRPPRDGARVLCQGRDVGVVTSGNFSPMLGVGIALALVEPSAAVIDTELVVRVRDTEMPARVVKRPFVTR